MLKNSSIKKLETLASDYLQRKWDFYMKTLQAEMDSRGDKMPDIYGPAVSSSVQKTFNDYSACVDMLTLALKAKIDTINGKFCVTLPDNDDLQFVNMDMWKIEN